MPHHFKFPTLFKGVYTSKVEIPGCGGGETTAPPITYTTCWTKSRYRGLASFQIYI